MPFWAIYSLRNSITFSVVGLLANDALGHPVLWSIATSKYFSFLGAILNGPAKSRASSSLNASAAASLPKFDCDFIGFKFLLESLHLLHVCASRTISRCICGHQISATACNIASRPGWPQWRLLKIVGVVRREYPIFRQRKWSHFCLGRVRWTEFARFSGAFCIDFCRNAVVI